MWEHEAWVWIMLAVFNILCIVAMITVVLKHYTGFDTMVCVVVASLMGAMAFAIFGPKVK